MVCQYDCEADPAEALSKAKLHLKKEFGRKIFTARQMLEELLSGPQLTFKDSDGIQEFIVKLERTYNVATKIKKEQTFNTQETFNEVLRKKLPFFSRKWATRVCDHEEKHLLDDEYEELNFSDFIKYLRRSNSIQRQNAVILKTEEAAPAAGKSSSATGKPAPTAAARNQRRAKVGATAVDQVDDETDEFEVDVAATTTSHPKKKTFQRKTAFKPTDDSQKTTGQASAETAGEPEKPNAKDKKCLACQTECHDLGECREFLKKSDKDRRAFVISNGLCFRCLIYGHISATCVSDIKCGECGDTNHNSVFHYDEKDENAEDI